MRLRCLVNYDIFPPSGNMHMSRRTRKESEMTELEVRKLRKGVKLLCKDKKLRKTLKSLYYLLSPLSPTMGTYCPEEKWS